MKVWIVEYQGYECKELWGVFSRWEAAEEYVARFSEATRQWMCVSDATLDVPLNPAPPAVRPS